mgnify:CR=1 FL=1
MIGYDQIEEQIHSDFTDDVLLVMQARSDGNEEGDCAEAVSDCIHFYRIFFCARRTRRVMNRIFCFSKHIPAGCQTYFTAFERKGERCAALRAAPGEQKPAFRRKVEFALRADLGRLPEGIRVRGQDPDLCDGQVPAEAHKPGADVPGPPYPPGAGGAVAIWNISFEFTTKSSAVCLLHITLLFLVFFFKNAYNA